MEKPIKPALHGIIDYVFSAIQLAAPTALGLNLNTVQIYSVLGALFAGSNALTKTPVAVKPIVSFKTHQKMDALFLSGLSILTFTKCIRKDNRALAFHLAFLATAVTHYLLTDYDAAEKKQEREIRDII